MNYDYEKICKLVSIGKEYVYKEKYKSWVKLVIESVLNNDREVGISIKAIKLINNGEVSSKVLDEIYSTRLEIDSIFNILDIILNYYVGGVEFIRDIYKDYMTSDIDFDLRIIEKNPRSEYINIMSRKHVKNEL